MSEPGHGQACCLCADCMSSAGCTAYRAVDAAKVARVVTVAFGRLSLSIWYVSQASTLAVGQPTWQAVAGKFLEEQDLMRMLERTPKQLFAFKKDYPAVNNSHADLASSGSCSASDRKANYVPRLLSRGPNIHSGNALYCSACIMLLGCSRKLTMERDIAYSTTAAAVTEC